MGTENLKQIMSEYKYGRHFIVGKSADLFITEL